MLQASVLRRSSSVLQGGYLSARYALANPDHVEHLILVCPAGVVSVSCAAGEEDVDAVLLLRFPLPTNCQYS
jgi:pimeloyl-ACP methyl ester carboxylesterase